MTFYTTVKHSDAFRDLFKRQEYEKYILTIINRSDKIFRGLSFESVPEQSAGQCDFIDNHGAKYDAKLLFDKEQGQLIGDPKNDVQQWIEAMQDEKTEFGESIRRRDLTFVDNTRLFGIMKKRVESLKNDENGIMFIPFPIVDDFKGSIFLQLATDFLQATFDRLKDQNCVGTRRIYFIYPSSNPHEYVLRNENRIREYIICPELKDFISFSTVAVPRK